MTGQEHIPSPAAAEETPAIQDPTEQATGPENENTPETTDGASSETETSNIEQDKPEDPRAAEEILAEIEGGLSKARLVDRRDLASPRNRKDLEDAFEDGPVLLDKLEHALNETEDPQELQTIARTVEDLEEACRRAERLSKPQEKFWESSLVGKAKIVGRWIAARKVTAVTSPLRARAEALQREIYQRRGEEYPNEERTLDAVRSRLTETFRNALAHTQDLRGLDADYIEAAEDALEDVLHSFMQEIAEVWARVGLKPAFKHSALLLREVRAGRQHKAEEYSRLLQTDLNQIGEDFDAVMETLEGEIRAIVHGHLEGLSDRPRPKKQESASGPRETTEPGPEHAKVPVPAPIPRTSGDKSQESPLLKKKDSEPRRKKDPEKNREPNEPLSVPESRVELNLNVVLEEKEKEILTHYQGRIAKAEDRGDVGGANELRKAARLTIEQIESFSFQDIGGAENVALAEVQEHTDRAVFGIRIRLAGRPRADISAAVENIQAQGETRRLQVVAQAHEYRVLVRQFKGRLFLKLGIPEETHHFSTEPEDNPDPLDAKTDTHPEKASLEEGPKQQPRLIEGTLPHDSGSPAARSEEELSRGLSTEQFLEMATNPPGNGVETVEEDQQARETPQEEPEVSPDTSESATDAPKTDNPKTTATSIPAVAQDTTSGNPPEKATA